MEYQVITPQGIEVTLTFSHNDEYGGYWFTDQNGNPWFAHNPEYPDTDDPLIALQYDYTIVE